MPEFYGGVGVDMLYPTGLGINTYSEPEWSSAQIVSMPATSSDSYQRYQPSPMPPHEYQDSYPTPEGTSRPPPIEVSSVPHHMINIPRPKSSPSTFGPNVEDLLFSENPFKFKQDDFRNDNYPSFSFPSPVPSAKSSPYFGTQPEYSASARTSPSRHIPIAPDPLGMRQLQTMKRMREDEEYEQTYGRKRKRTASSSGPVELNEEEQLLLKLKEEENLPWKDIATRFQTELGKTYQVPALQMRFKRLRERMRSWTDADVKALEEAHDYWEKCQFDIISTKMLEFGATERWPAKLCARKWEELHPNDEQFVLSPEQPTGFPATNYAGAIPLHQPIAQYSNNGFEHPSFSQPQHAFATSTAAASHAPSPPASGPSTAAAAAPSPWQFLPDPWASGHASPVESVSHFSSHNHPSVTGGMMATPQQTPYIGRRSVTPNMRRSMTPQASSVIDSHDWRSARQTPQPAATL